jgi:hypothetical protein
MNEKIARMIREIERRGGAIGIHGETPDDIAEFFLAEILDCPDCLEEAIANGARLDPVPNRREPQDH